MGITQLAEASKKAFGNGPLITAKCEVKAPVPAKEGL